MKLDHKVFDEIYEACKRDGKWTQRKTEKYTDNFAVWVSEFAHNVWSKYAWGMDGDFSDGFMELYRSGEIRDAGPYPQKPRKVEISFVEPCTTSKRFHFSTWNMPETPWYKLPADVFDPLVALDDTEFSHRVCEENPRLWPVVGRAAATCVEKDGKILKSLYRAGIIRDKGKMPEKQDYTKAFSVKGNTMYVDWDKIEVTEENALEISIASWEWFYEEVQKCGNMLDRNNACALCRIYVSGNFCLDTCPIKIATGASTCFRTPFYRWAKAKTLHEALDACREEIEFLKNLQ